MQKTTVNPFDPVNRVQQDRIECSDKADVNHTLFGRGEHENGQWYPGHGRDRPENFQRDEERVREQAGTGHPNSNRHRQNGAQAEAREDANQARTDMTCGIWRLNESDECFCDRARAGNVTKVYQQVKLGLASQLPKANKDKERCPAMDKANDAARILGPIAGFCVRVLGFFHHDGLSAHRRH
jgi:hypothetical protein